MNIASIGSPRDDVPAELVLVGGGCCFGAQALEVPQAGQPSRSDGTSCGHWHHLISWSQAMHIVNWGKLEAVRLQATVKSVAGDRPVIRNLVVHSDPQPCSAQ